MNISLSRYKLKDMRNANEFGLLYQELPKKTMHIKGEKCSDGKYKKVRLTGTAAANEKLDEQLLKV